MSDGDGRKRLSGSEYRKRGRLKAKEQDQVINKTLKIENFFVSDNVCKENKNGEKSETVVEKIEEPQPLEENIAEHEIVDDYVNAGQESGSTPFEEHNSCTEHDLNKDPAFWVLNDTTRDIIAKYGFAQNNLGDFQSSKRNYPDQSRFLSKTLFDRKMTNGEINHRSWLVYSESKGAVFCGPCLAFGKSSTSQFHSKDGFNDWKNAESRVSHHENSPAHKSSIIDLKARSIAMNRIDNNLLKQIDEETSYWRNILTRVVAAVRALTSRGLALRGDNTTIGSNRNGNYLMALELIAEFDPFLSNHISKFGNPGSGHTNYLSATICDEIIQLMAERVKSKICSELKQAKYFSIVVDSTPDVSHTDQLTLAVRYVLPDGTPTERFLTFIPSVGHKADQMLKAVMKEFESQNIDVSDCRGQSYDNASNMAGIYSGLQAKIKELAPLGMFVPCAAHSLNLVGTSAAESCNEACHFFMLLQELYVFFTSSTNRWERLMSEVYKGKTLKKLSSTRWSARDDACQSVRENWDEVLLAITYIENDNSEKATTRCEATGIRKKLERFETAFMVCFWSTILHRLHKTSKKIQSPKMDVLTVTELYASLVEFCTSQRHNFEYYESLALKLSENKSYEKDFKRAHERNRKHDTGSAEDVDLDGRESFKINTFLVIIDQFIVEFKRRYEAYSDYKDRFNFLAQIVQSSGKLDESTLRANAKNLVNIYRNDLDDDFVDECSHFQAYCVSAVDKFEDCSLQGISNYLRYHSLEDVYPNVDIALRICLSIPATNCSGERSFSCLKRVKNYLRSTLREEKLNALSILCIESDLAATVDYSVIIDDFARRKARRKVFYR